MVAQSQVTSIFVDDERPDGILFRWRSGGHPRSSGDRETCVVGGTYYHIDVVSVRKPDDVSLGRTRSGSRVYVSYPPPTVVCGSAVAFCCTVRTILLYFLPLAILVTSCTLLLVTILFSRLQLPSRIGNVWNRLGQFWHSLFVRATRYASDKRSTRHVLMSRCGAHGGGGCSGGGLILRYQKAHGAPPLSPVQCAIVLWLFALWSLSQNSSIVWFSTRIF
jgi:hypothetical protein